VTGHSDDVDEAGDKVARADAARQKRRARVFGDVLPESTSDDRGDAWGDREGNADDWLRRQVPPHHG
jgi:hypothetical protein